jgi:hypothetical protein
LRARGGELAGAALGIGEAGAAEAGVAGSVEGDAVEPAGQALGAGQRGGLAQQGEEGGLEGVLGGVGVAQDAAADGQDHRAVPADEQGEGVLLAGVAEARQQLAVGQVRGGAAPGQAEGGAQGAVVQAGGHAGGPSGGGLRGTVRGGGGASVIPVVGGGRDLARAACRPLGTAGNLGRGGECDKSPAQVVKGKK